MDADRFDALVRVLDMTTRRNALRLLAGVTLGSVGRDGARATHTGCRHHDARCKRDEQCCSGECSQAAVQVPTRNDQVRPDRVLPQRRRDLLRRSVRLGLVEP